MAQMFELPMVKHYRCKGTIEIEAENLEEAVDKLEKMMYDRQNPLQTVDPRISWEEPEYLDDTFDINWDDGDSDLQDIRYSCWDDDIGDDDDFDDEIDDSDY